jgi:ferric-dicitrate binding protein FerR (iron transport regulator)
MLTDRIKTIISKYLSNQASNSELDELGLWLEESAHQKEFYYYVKTNYAINFNLQKFNSKHSKKQLLALIDKDKKVIRFRSIVKFAAAASILLVITLTVFFQREANTQLVEPAVVNSIEPGTDKATLTLEDGTQVTLEKGVSFQLQNASSDGEGIIYQTGEKNTKEVVYNYLTIPRGGQFFIKLSDGTQVWLNSESKLKYPINFKENETRKVELVYGEAYFDVSPSSAHNGTKFIVYNQFQEIEVLGTEFNIKAYRDETNIYTTLVEGKVSVNTPISNQILKPSQQTNFNLEANSMTISEVNVYNEVSWKDGVLSFRRKPLADIMKVLSRWYDVEIYFANDSIKKAGFNGVLGKDQNIEEILKTIKNFGVINDYNIEDKHIILK